MNYLKLFEHFKNDIEDILIEYIDKNKVRVIKNDFYWIYKFKNLKDFNSAKERLKSFNIDFKLSNSDGEGIKSILILKSEVMEFLDSKFKNLKTQENDNYVYYFNDLNNKKTRNFYDKKNHIFYIDYYSIWSVFKSDFNDIQRITTYYVVNNLHNDCIYTDSRKNILTVSN